MARPPVSRAHGGRAALTLGLALLGAVSGGATLPPAADDVGPLAAWLRARLHGPARHGPAASSWRRTPRLGIASA